MSFETEIQEPISDKVILFEVDIGKAINFWIPVFGGVYICNFFNTYSKLTSFTTVPTLPSIAIVGSVIANGIQLQQVSTPLLCIETNLSFYWESATRTLYIHCDKGDNPALFNIRVGQVYGFRKGGKTSIYGGTIFSDRLIDVPEISLNKDAQFWGVIAFDSNTIKIVNSDAEYDLLTRNNYIFGAKARLLAGFDDWPIEDFEQIYEGFINKINTSETEVSFEVKDQRIALSKEIPSNVFTTAAYPNLASDDIGKPIPRVFGTCRNIPITIVDENQTVSTAAGTTTTYHAKISDTAYTTAISAVSAIYVNGRSVTTKIGSLNLGTRTFTIKHTTRSTNMTNPSPYVKGAEVTADVVGELSENSTIIKNGGAVIRKLLYDYYDYNFIGDYYNLAKWEENKTRDICLYLGERKPIIDVINNICADGIQADFYITQGGKLALKVFDENYPVNQTINRNEILSTPTIEDNPDKILTSIAVGYSHDWQNDEYKIYIDDDDESDLFNTFSIYRQKEFNTLCSNITDAQDYITTLKTYCQDVETIFTIQVPGWISIKREIGDIVVVYLNRPFHEMYGRVKSEVIGISKNLNEHIVSLTCRMIERMDYIPYTQGYYYTDETAESQGGENNYYGEFRYYSETINEG